MTPQTPPPLNTAALLREYRLRPNKKLGQNFLQDPAILEKIVQVAGVSQNDTVLEIGPGLGSLTRHLAANAKAVIAVEIDKKIIPALQASISGYANAKIVNEDILEISPAEIINEPEYLVVANIPYYITSAILRHLLENHPRPRRMVLTIQKEVAQRICAEEKLSLLALSVQVYGDHKIAMKIPAGAFYPAPNVDSALIDIALHNQPHIPSELLDSFFKLAKAGFSQKRKTLRNSLSAGLQFSTSQAEELLTNTGIDPKRRAETLSLDEWRLLTENWAKG